MNTKKILMVCLAFLGLSNISISQGFERLIYTLGVDHNHYSIETTRSGNYVVAGTQFDASGRTDIHVLLLDPNGNTIWERIVDVSNDDRALDVTIGRNDHIVVTGYVTRNPKAELYVFMLDPAGNMVIDRKLDYNIVRNQATAGTNIIYNANRDVFIVGGAVLDQVTYPISGNVALLMELDGGLNPTGNTFIYNGSINRHSAINDIVQIDNGYYATGSVGLVGSATQGVLSIFLDNALNLTANLSFHSTNSEQNGVSAAYDTNQDYLYLMSNNSVIHNPQITVIRDPNGSPSIINQYYLELDPTYGQYNAAGFHLKMSPWDPDNLVAMGYYRTDYPGSTVNGQHATPWIAEFRKDRGDYVLGMIWDAPSTNFHSHGGGTFSTFQGEHPYIFEQEIFTERADGNGFVFISPNDITGDYAIEVVTTVQSKMQECYDEIRYRNINIGAADFHINDDPVSYFNSRPGFPYDDYRSDVDQYCRVPAAFILPSDNDATNNNQNSFGEAQGTIHDATADFNVLPNPFTDQITINLLDQKAGGEFVLSNALGQIVYRSGIITNDHYTTRIDMEAFDSGIYFLKYINGDKQSTKRLIKM